MGGLGKNFFSPNLWRYNFFPDIQWCKMFIFFSIIRHDKYIFLSAGYFFPRKQSAPYFFSEITETSLKSSMVGHLEGYV